MSILSKNEQCPEIHDLKSEITEPCILDAFFSRSLYNHYKIWNKNYVKSYKNFFAASAAENAQLIDK